MSTSSSKLFPQDQLLAPWRDLVIQVKGNRNWSESMIFLTAFAAAAYVCAPHAQAQWPNCEKISHLTTYSFVIAKPGSGKTPIFDALFKAIFKRLKSKTDRQDEAFAQFENVQTIWELKKKGLAKALVKAIQQGQSGDLQTDAMAKHLMEEPVEPTEDRTIIQKMTASAFKKVMGGHHPRLFLASDDAAAILDSGVLDHPSIQCSVWESSSVTMIDGAYAHDQFDDALLSIHLMTQPEFFEDFLSARRGAAKKSGFMARCLIAKVMPTDNAGQVEHSPVEGERIQWFEDRLDELQDSTDERRVREDFSRVTLIFSPEAARLWEEEREAMERLMQPGGRLENISEFVAKAMDHICRVAGVFHFFQGNEGPIQSDTLKSAIAVVQFYIGEYKRIFDDTDDDPQFIKDAWCLLKYLDAHYVNASQRQKRSMPIPCNDLLSGPHRFHGRGGATRMHMAVDHLVSTGFITLSLPGQKKHIHLKLGAFEDIKSEILANTIPRDFYRAIIIVPQNTNMFQDEVAGPPEYFSGGLGWKSRK